MNNINDYKVGKGVTEVSEDENVVMSYEAFLKDEAFIEYLLSQNSISDSEGEEEVLEFLDDDSSEDELSEGDEVLDVSDDDSSEDDEDRLSGKTSIAQNKGQGPCSSEPSEEELKQALLMSLHEIVLESGVLKERRKKGIATEVVLEESKSLSEQRASKYYKKHLMSIYNRNQNSNTKFPIREAAKEMIQNFASLKTVISEDENYLMEYLIKLFYDEEEYISSQSSTNTSPVSKEPKSATLIVSRDEITNCLASLKKVEHTEKEVPESVDFRGITKSALKEIIHQLATKKNKCAKTTECCALGSERADRALETQSSNIVHLTSSKEKATATVLAKTTEYAGLPQCTSYPKKVGCNKEAGWEIKARDIGVTKSHSSTSNIAKKDYFYAHVYSKVRLSSILEYNVMFLQHLSSFVYHVVAELCNFIYDTSVYSNANINSMPAQPVQISVL